MIKTPTPEDFEAAVSICDSAELTHSGKTFRRIAQAIALARIEGEESERQTKKSITIDNDTNTPAGGAMTVNDFLKWASISKVTLYKEAKHGNIVLRKAGRRTLIRRADAEKWLDSLPTT